MVCNNIVERGQQTTTTTYQKSPLKNKNNPKQQQQTRHTPKPGPHSFLSGWSNFSDWANKWADFSKQERIFKATPKQIHRHFLPCPVREKWCGPQAPISDLMTNKEFINPGLSISPGINVFLDNVSISNYCLPLRVFNTRHAVQNIFYEDTGNHPHWCS